MALGCAESHPLAPSGRLVGRWGGVDAELTATTRTVRLQLMCGPIEFLAPLEPAPNGAFVIPTLGRGGSDARPLPPTILRGRVVATTMEVELSYLLPDATRTVSFKLAKDQPPSWPTLCVALGQ